MHYLRPEHHVGDARELNLTLAPWAGQNSAEAMRHEPDRITGSVSERVG
ncbi:hypothetical protein [Streptomyces sp. CBMA123]|nr:hypothetical protein [Streptomyces sp. CBMA123]